MNKRLYVGGLSYSVGDDELKKLFATCGEVSFVKIIRDPSTGRSKGFGFVEMVLPEQAQGAIVKLDGTVYENRAITVSEAKPTESGGRGGRGGNRGGNRYSGANNRNYQSRTNREPRGEEQF